MVTRFDIASSDPALLEKARRIGDDFARPYMREDVTGIMFLGAIARGYFDASADIDVGIFKLKASPLSIPSQFIKVEGIEIHCWLESYEDQLAASWDMGKRWAYSQGRIVYDPQGKLAGLLGEKLPLKPDEKKWLLMSGLTLSEWYINRLTQLWVERGSLVSAHHMFHRGLDHFYEMLFALNNQLVADTKWRYYYAERLSRLPQDFQAQVREMLLLREVSQAELDRRRLAFMQMWEPMRTVVERELGMSYDQMIELV